MRDPFAKYRQGLPGPDGWSIPRQAVDDVIDGKPQQDEAFKWVLPAAGAVVAVIAFLIFR